MIVSFSSHDTSQASVFHKLTLNCEFFQIKYIKVHEYDMKTHIKTQSNSGLSVTLTKIKTYREIIIGVNTPLMCRSKLLQALPMINP